MAKAPHKEEELRLSEEKYRRLVETSSDWIWEVDAQGLYTYASPKVRDILGYEPEEVLGKTPWDFMPPEEAAENRQIFKALLDSRQAITTVENVNIHKDGRQVVLETSGTPILDAQGEMVGYHGIDRDITARVMLEAAIRQSEQRFRFLFHNTQDCVVLLDRDLKYLYANPAADAYLGHSADGIAGKNLRGVFAATPEFRDLWVQRLGRIFANGEPTRVEDCIELGARMTWSESSIAPIKNPDGKVTAVGIIYRDISERKKMEAERQQLISELRQALTQIETLQGILPICSYCKKIRDNAGRWSKVEDYISVRSQAQFSHGICPSCMKAYFDDDSED